MLKKFFTTASAIAQGIKNKTTGKYNGPAVMLETGDRAPEFRLQGSDGRTYSLSEFSGRAVVVVAWFPKAFTGG